MSAPKSFDPVFGGRVEMFGPRPGVQWTEPGMVSRHLFALLGKSIDVVIREVLDKDIRQMQRYWWAVPVPLLADHCGYTDAQMHYVLLEECFGVTVGPKGMRVPNQPHSSYLSFEKWRHLIDWVLVFGPTELGVVIPPPRKVEPAPDDRHEYAMPTASAQGDGDMGTEAM